jgi:gamma-glutamyl:cysteine ligase YbdK (ATP-grasp superfamily)
VLGAGGLSPAVSRAILQPRHTTSSSWYEDCSRWPGVGIEISREQFDDADHAAFAAKLQRNLEALRIILARPGFGAGPLSMGAELEVNLVDSAGRPMPVNRAVLADARDPRITLEVNRYNLEINARPVAMARRPFSAMHDELATALGSAQRAAERHGARVVSIGILPTLTEQDLDSGMLTDSRRYRALSAGLLRARGRPFRVQISGQDELSIPAHDVTFEGANTSFQVHLRVDPEHFAATYNAAQMATPLALAVAGNSPFFLGRRLWDETRIALFRQSVDDRADLADDDWRPARVSFGHGWVRRSAAELFSEAVALHEPLLPMLGTEDPEAVLAAGGMPELGELRLHHGTVWRWNRAVYDASAGGHLRIELRALPAGPTLRDMIANMAFLLGLTLGLAPSMDQHVTRLTFGQARRNFYAAARFGLDAELLWPTSSPPSPRRAGVLETVHESLPLARFGLVALAGVAAEEADTWLELIRTRAERRRTGALWQRATWARLRERLDPRQASAGMLARYIELSSSGAPVHDWPLPGSSDSVRM